MQKEHKRSASSKRKIGIALIAGLAMSGIIGASAATLGDLNSDQLGADATEVTSCDTDGVDIAYTTAYAAASNRYDVATIEISDINADCVGQDYSFTLAGLDAAGDPVGLATLDGEVTGTTLTLTPSGSVAAGDVLNAALVISGVEV